LAAAASYLVRYARGLCARLRAFGERSIVRAVVNADPVVVKEAGTSVLPVVSSRQGGIPEIVVHGETGWLAPERDVDALAQSLRMLAADRRLRARAGEAARARIAGEYDTVKPNRALEALPASVM
jgi:colanic acid/amylovoran biosynthesis glycosyltransferase